MIPFNAHAQATGVTPPSGGSEATILAYRLLAQAQAALDDDLSAARACLGQLSSLLKSHRLGPPASSNAPPAPKGGLAPWQMRRVAAHVQVNLGQRIHVESLAGLVRLSTSHFCRAFKVSFGQTPHAYVMDRRLDLARHMMLTTSESLCQISVVCGLADQAHLTRLFRRHFDETPYQWRRAWRQNAGSPVGAFSPSGLADLRPAA